MPTTRPFAFNSGSTISGTSQVGNLAIGVSIQDYSGNPGGVKWWMGPDEDLGYVITHQTVPPTQPTQIPGVTAGLGFWRSLQKTENSFLELCNCIPPRAGQLSFATALECQTWLGYSGYWTSYSATSSTQQFYAATFSNSPFSNTNIVRMNSDGTRDTSFQISSVSGFNSTVKVISIQSDGKLLVGGFFTLYSGVTYNRIIRLNTDGTVDNTFTTGTGFNADVYWIDTQSDGSIIVVGNFTQYSGVSVGRIAKLTSTGSLGDNTNFGAGFPGGIAYSCKVISSGVLTDYILVVGSFTNYKAGTVNRIALLNPTGTLDTTYWTSNYELNSTSFSVDESPNGDFWTVGNFTSFGNTGTYLTQRYERISYYGGGYVGSNGFNAGPNFVKVQPDGKPVIIGGFSSFTDSNGTTVNANGFLRINRDSSIDQTFNTGTGVGTSNFPSALEILNDGTLLIGGPITTYSGTSVSKLIKINPTGSLNTSFSYFSGFTNINFIIAKP